MASDVYPSEETRSPRFGSKQQLISLVSTLFILLVSDYVIKSIIYILYPGPQPRDDIPLTSPKSQLDNVHFSFYEKNVFLIFRSSRVLYSVFFVALFGVTVIK